MSSSPARTPVDAEMNAILRAAVEWHDREEAGEMLSDNPKFLQWLEADERHAAAFGEIELTWNLLDRASQVPAAVLGMPAAVSPISEPRSQKTWWRSLAFTAAATGAAAAIVLGFLALDLDSPRSPAPQSAEKGIVKRLDLEDGSVVRLNSESRVEVSFGRDSRRVKLLQGEAHFTVTKDSARPFVVSAGLVDVQAVGTAFNVILGKTQVDVLVTEGRVNVVDLTAKTPANGSVAAERVAPEVLLTAGQRTVVFSNAEVAAPKVANLEKSEITRALAWQDRWLEFDSAPLEEIVAAFNRSNSRQLVIAGDSPGLTKQRFAGSFRADDPDTFVRMLEGRLDIVVKQRAGVTVLHLTK